jgi:hypothetical protein
MHAGVADVQPLAIRCADDRPRIGRPLHHIIEPYYMVVAVVSAVVAAVTFVLSRFT